MSRIRKLTGDDYIPLSYDPTLYQAPPSEGDPNSWPPRGGQAYVPPDDDDKPKFEISFVKASQLRNSNPSPSPRREVKEERPYVSRETIRRAQEHFKKTKWGIINELEKLVNEWKNDKDLKFAKLVSIVFDEFKFPLLVSVLQYEETFPELSKKIYIHNDKLTKILMRENKNIVHVGSNLANALFSIMTKIERGETLIRDTAPYFNDVILMAIDRARGPLEIDRVRKKIGDTFIIDEYGEGRSRKVVIKTAVGEPEEEIATFLNKWNNYRYGEKTKVKIALFAGLRLFTLMLSQPSMIRRGLNHLAKVMRYTLEKFSEATGLVRIPELALRTAFFFMALFVRKLKSFGFLRKRKTKGRPKLHVDFKITLKRRYYLKGLSPRKWKLVMIEASLMKMAKIVHEVWRKHGIMEEIEDVFSRAGVTKYFKLKKKFKELPTYLFIKRILGRDEYMKLYTMLSVLPFDEKKRVELVAKMIITLTYKDLTPSNLIEIYEMLTGYEPEFTLRDIVDYIKKNEILVNVVAPEVESILKEEEDLDFIEWVYEKAQAVI